MAYKCCPIYKSGGCKQLEQHESISASGFLLVWLWTRFFNYELEAKESHGAENNRAQWGGSLICTGETGHKFPSGTGYYIDVGMMSEGNLEWLRHPVDGITSECMEREVKKGTGANIWFVFRGGWSKHASGKKWPEQTGSGKCKANHHCPETHTAQSNFSVCEDKSSQHPHVYYKYVSLTR